jgi:hypothetical protein
MENPVASCNKGNEQRNSEILSTKFASEVHPLDHGIIRAVKSALS